MTSTFTWLDYTDRDRRKVMDVLEQFAERTTQDDLGIGTIRDAFADILFPGTSTIHTRAKYMLFIPWIYLECERKSIPSSQIQSRAREQEVSLIHGLLNSGESKGVIGQQARNKLRRLPSEAYWRALGFYGIRRFEGNQSDYHRYLDTYYRLRKSKVDSFEPGAEAAESGVRNWHADLPPRPKGFPQQAGFALDEREAEFLADRIRLSTGGSMLAALVDIGMDSEVDFPWEHPQLGELSQQIQEQLRQARTFSELFYGAALIYNHMLSTKAIRESDAEWYSNEFAGWTVGFAERQQEYANWDRKEFWAIVQSHGARITPRTREFVEAWWILATSRAPNDLLADATVHQLLASRESYLKGPLARLQNARALEMWGGAAGAFQFDFRWGNARMIVSDIRAGLNPNA
jgi:hypothetical protein